MRVFGNGRCWQCTGSTGQAYGWKFPIYSSSVSFQKCCAISNRGACDRWTHECTMYLQIESWSSRLATLQDIVGASANHLSSLTLRSDLRPALLPSGEAQPLLVSDQKTTIVGRPDVANKQSVTTLINHEHSTPKAETRPATTDVEKPASDKLKQESDAVRNFIGGKPSLLTVMNARRQLPQ